MLAPSLFLFLGLWGVYLYWNFERMRAYICVWILTARAYLYMNGCLGTTPIVWLRALWVWDQHTCLCALPLPLCPSLLISREAEVGMFCWSGLSPFMLKQTENVLIATRQTEIIGSYSPPFHKASGTWAHCSEWASIIHPSCWCGIDIKLM